MYSPQIWIKETTTTLGTDPLGDQIELDLDLYITLGK